MQNVWQDATDGNVGCSACATLATTLSFHQPANAVKGVSALSIMPCLFMELGRTGSTPWAIIHCSAYSSSSANCAQADAVNSGNTQTPGWTSCTTSLNDVPSTAALNAGCRLASGSRNSAACRGVYRSRTRRRWLARLSPAGSPGILDNPGSPGRPGKAAAASLNAKRVPTSASP